jgi:hypothetical protein
MSEMLIREPVCTDQLPKVVNIVATGYRWEDCVWNIDGEEYWTLNNMHGDDFVAENRIDLWFQMHLPGSGEGHIDDEHHIQWLRNPEGPPVLMQHQIDEFPRSVRYPIEDVINLCCPKNVNGHPRPYFTNSVDFMTCYAMYKGYDVIKLWGVEFVSSVDDEYLKMRQSCEYYLGKAEGMGISVVIQDHSSLLKASHFYGYERTPKDPIELALQQNIDTLNAEYSQFQAQLNEIQAEIQTRHGALQAMKQTRKMLKLRARGVQL